MGAALAPAPVRRRLACHARTPSTARVKGKRTELAGQVFAQRKVSRKFRADLDALSWRGCIGVARRRVLHVPGRCRQHRFPPRASMRRAATTRSEALRGGKRERRQSTRMPHGALSVGRWAGCARRRGCKGRNAPCRRGGCREPRREPVPCLAPGTRQRHAALRLLCAFGSPRDSPAYWEQQSPLRMRRGLLRR